MIEAARKAASSEQGPAEDARSRAVEERLGELKRSMEVMRASMQWLPQHSSGINLAPNGARVLAPLDKKIIPKPKPYSGAIKDYAAWNTRVKDFLQTQDERWKPLLEEVEKLGAEVITDETQRMLELKSDLKLEGQLQAFVSQLYTYLQAFSTGTRGKKKSCKRS